MNLTERQRQQLGESPEWRELQWQKMNLYSYLGNTRLEDLQFDGLHEALAQLATRTAMFFDRLNHSPGGQHGDIHSGAVCLAGGIHDEHSGRNADASGEHADDQTPGTSGPNATRGGLYAC